MPINYTDELRLAYLRAAIAAQAEIEAKISAYRAFYDGEQGAVLTDRQKEYLTGRGDGQEVESFGNMCKRVVNVPKDRLELRDKGIAPADPAASTYAEAVTGWWNANFLQARQKEIYEAGLRDGQIAVIVGWDGIKPTYTPNLVYDGSTGLVRFHYDSDGHLLAASKRWKKFDPIKMAETGKTRLNLYLPDQVIRYEADEKIAGGWRLLSPPEVVLESAGNITQNPQPWVARDGTPLGIAVIPFENPGGSELEDVITLQKLINHNLGEFDVAVDMHNWPLLWGAGIDLPVDPATGKKYVPTHGASQMFTLAADGKMDRIEPADLEKMFRAGVLSWVHVLALIKGWPLFVLDHSTQPPSGVALRIMEGGLVSQVQGKQAEFGGDWLAAFELGRKLHRFYTGQELAGELTLTWQPAETEDTTAKSDSQAKTWEAAQIPIIQRWRELGYTDAQIEQMLADKQREDDLGLADTVTGIAQ